MKPILLLAGVMLFIIITGCSKDNPTTTKNFDVGKTKVTATEYLDESGKLGLVVIQCDTLGETLGGKITFDTQGIPMISGAVSYNLDQLQLLMKVMETYRPPSRRPPKG
jgi:hypothetical protein